MRRRKEISKTPNSALKTQPTIQKKQKTEIPINPFSRNGQIPPAARLDEEINGENWSCQKRTNFAPPRRTTCISDWMKSRAISGINDGDSILSWQGGRNTDTWSRPEILYCRTSNWAGRFPLQLKPLIAFFVSPTSDFLSKISGGADNSVDRLFGNQQYLRRYGRLKLVDFVALRGLAIWHIWDLFQSATPVYFGLYAKYRYGKTR